MTENKLEYSCDGPFLFGPDINKVCCHGWNCPHFLTNEEADKTNRLIRSGVITHPTERNIQQIEKVEK